MCLPAFASCGDVGDPNYVPPQRTALNQADLDNAPWCIGTCLPDYGSQRTDCTADDGLEFFPYDVLNPTEGGTVAEFYAYNDNTNDFMVAGPDPYNPNPMTVPTNFAPPSVTVNDRCGPDNQIGAQAVHHIRGGLFREWGGGMGRRLVNFLPDCSYPAAEDDPAYCVEADPRIESVADLPENSMFNLRTNFYGMMADLREWEGISFWARSGPNNTAGIRVGLGDRQLDDDIAFLETKAGLAPMCERVRECGCRNHRPCTENTDGTFSCWQPGLDPSPEEVLASGGLVAVNEDIPYEACGITACNEGNPAFAAGDVVTNLVGIDPPFATPEHPAYPEGTAQCLPYKLTNDLQDYFCYTPPNPETGDPGNPPADGPDRCGDVWAKGVTLTTDWQFYKIPFTELRQEGYAKLFGNLDLSKITLVRFTWMQGWVDVWLDDVRFYRHIRQ